MRVVDLLRACGCALPFAVGAACRGDVPVDSEPAAEVVAFAPPAPAPPPPAPVWPEEGAPLTLVASSLPADWRPLRVVIDAGHGAIGNHGNTSVQCVREEDFTRGAADRLAAGLGAGFEVRRTREDERPVPYDARVALAEGWPADALIGLHSDAREVDTMAPHPVTGCNSNDGAHGFSVLYSDEGDPKLVTARRDLARALAARLLEAGFPAYRWDGYADLYDGDPAHPGVFVDRHAPKRRIKMLRVPQVPGVIVETHQALDLDEARRWEEDATHAAFAAAVRAALIDVRWDPR